MAQIHDAYRQLATQNVAYNAAVGASAASTTFSSQTYYVRLCAPGSLSGTVGVRYQVGASPTATNTSTLLPANWIEYVKVNPGESIAFISNDTVTGTISITELTD
jgi:hypothetical protein